MASRFTHLHTHSHYSFLQALPKVEELVAAAKAEGMEALALTDTGNLHGAIEFYKVAKEAGIKPIIGVDAYVAPRSRFEKDRNSDAKRSRIILLAENNEGYKNLLYLVTKSWTEGFFERPRIDKELLRERGSGLIAIIPSFAGEVVQQLRAGDPAGAAAALSEYESIFGKNNLFLEITHHPKVASHEDLMKKVVELSKQTSIPLVAQHDVYYLRPDDREACEIMRRIQQGERGRNEDEDFSFISATQAENFFKHLPDALESSGTIADRCNVSFELGKWIFPSVPISPGFKTHADELRATAYVGIKKRGLTETDEVKKRIEYELKIIIDKGFAVYYLIVADLLAFARRAGILTTTRGSAAGSLVAYLCGITNVDPLFYKLPFERFLNPERPKAPDIDMDMADNRRDDMIAYAKQKYGEDHVAQIGTFGTMMARAAVRDVARALGHSYTTGDRIAKLIPIGSQGFPMTIDHALELEPDLKSLYDEDDDARQIIDLAKRIEGCVRHVGVHAAGVVVAPTPLIEWVPIQPDPKGTGKLITQYDMYSITDEYGGVGLLKFDFLGIKNLSILADSVVRVRETRNIIVDIENVPIDDLKTFEMLARGETEGIFQLNGSGMTRWLKELKPTTIHDINAMVALYRPGPMDVIPEYIERKHNPKLIKYLDPRMKDYLTESYGLLVYQDDLLLSAVHLAGYSWGEVDKFRKAIGKKLPVEMAAQEKQFTEGVVKHGQTADFAAKIWKLFEPFQAYGFNKCLPANTRILDAKTGAPVTISTIIREGRGFLVHALARDLKLTKASANQPFQNGVKQLLCLTTRSGRIIRATGNHPLRTFSGWTRLDALSAGDRIAAPRRLAPPKHIKKLAPYRAATLGYLISEGNLCHPNGIYFYSTQDDEVADFIQGAKQFSNSSVTLDRSKSATSVYIGQKDQKKGNVLNQWIVELGLKDKKATNKFVPSIIFSADDLSIQQFLGKLWQGDGCISLSNWQIYYATSSRVLAEDVQHLLLRFDTISTIHTKSFLYRGGRKTGWTVVVSGHENLTRFEKTAGKHLIGKKRAALTKLVAKTSRRRNNLGRGTSDTIPAEIVSSIRHEMSLCNVNTKALARKAGVAERLLSRDTRKRGMTRDTLYKIGHALKSKMLIEYATSDIFWDEVVSIVPNGREMTYDLSVPGHENFVADGLVVHNSHAASYGKVAYQTAYMKANFPVEYMSAVLTADAGDTEQIAIFVAETKRMKISVLPPDVNESGTVFAVVGEKKDAIRFGLSSIKNFGDGVSEAIIKEREAQGQYTSLTDFLGRVPSKNLNRKSLEALIKCGALDRFEHRGTLLQNIESLLTFHRDMTAPESQNSLFGATLSAPPTLALKKGEPVSLKEKLEWEKELLGIYVSGHPLDAHEATLAKARASIGTIKAEPQPGLPVIMPVLVQESRNILTKSGEKMSFIKLSDKTGEIEAVAFPRLYKQHGALFTPGACLLIKANVTNRNGEISLALENVKVL